MAGCQDLLLRLESRRRGRQVTVRRELVLAEDGGGPVVVLLGLGLLQTTIFENGGHSMAISITRHLLH